MQPGVKFLQRGAPLYGRLSRPVRNLLLPTTGAAATLVSTEAAMLRWMVRRVARPRRSTPGSASSSSLNSATGAACGIQLRV
jgi:hypothetical protein